MGINTLAGGILVAASVCIALAGCDKRPEAKAGPREAAAIPVTLQPVKIEPVQRTVEVVGTLWGDEDATISSKTSGRVVAIYKDVGDRVKSGEALAQIAPTDYELARRQKEFASREPLAKLGLTELPGPDFDLTKVPTAVRAKLQADNAEAKFNRAKKLHDQTPPLLSDQDYADLKTTWEVARSAYDVELLTARGLLAEARSAQADLDMTVQRLSDTTIRAPAARPVVLSGATTAPATEGKEREYALAARLVSTGEFAKEGQNVFRLIDDDPVKLRALVPEPYVRDIQLGQKVRISVEAYEESFPGEVARINPQIDPANRTFIIEVIAPNKQHRMKPGAFARGLVEIRMDPKVVFVPQESVITFAGINKVFTIADGKAVEHAVELGERHGDYVEVVKGLSKADLVIVGGASKLASGVSVVMQKAATTRNVAVLAN
jgi:multidrug efflux pump subunit AcrA (membrane-fusion protein)